MPIHRSIETVRISQAEFKSIASEVMRNVFDIHNDFGRFFDELIYKRELAARLDGVALEVSVTLIHSSFSKTYFADVLVSQRGLFEFKAVEAIHARHRGQTINYLLLFDLAHAKIINVRPERVEHEFVNCHLRLADLENLKVIDEQFDQLTPGAEAFRDTLMALVCDWGGGLETSLYEEALIHMLGGESDVCVFVPVRGTKGYLAEQRMRLVAPDVAFKITAFPDGETERYENFRTHAFRLIKHTSLTAIHWANITHQSVRFATIRR